MAENFVLNKQIIEKAKNISCKIDDSDLRKRTYALNIAANGAEEYLLSKGFYVNTKLSLYKIPSFAESLEFADIYVNNVRLDVRVTFDEKSFYIPKIHEKYDAVPCAYLVTKLDSDLKNIKILGFISSAELDKQQKANEYYCYESSILKPIEELKSFIFAAKPENDVPSPEEFEKVQELAVAFVDGSLSDSEKVYFIKTVIKYAACREVLTDMSDFDSVASHVSNYSELLNDSTLSVLSGNTKEVDEVLIASMATLENSEENDISELEVADDTADFVNDEEILTEDGSDDDLVFESEQKADENSDLDSDLMELDIKKEETELLDIQDDSEITIDSETSETEEDKNSDGLEYDTLKFSEFNENTEDNINLNNPDEDIISDSLLELEEATDEISSDDILADTDSVSTNDVEEVAKLSFDGADVDELSESEENLIKTEENSVEELIFSEDKEERMSDLQEDARELIPNEDIETISVEADDENLHETEHSAIDNSDLTISEHAHEEDSLLISEENDDMLLEEFSEEEQSEKPKEPVIENIERKPFVLSLEGEEEAEIPEAENQIEEESSIVDDSVEVEQKTQEMQSVQEVVEEPQSQEVEEESVYTSQTPVEMVYDEEETVDENNEDAQIQELLDDDLLALLSDSDDKNSSETASAQVNNSQDVLENAEHTDETVSEPVNQNSNIAFEANEEIPENSPENETIGALFEADGEVTEGEAKSFELDKEPVSEKTMKTTKNLAITFALLFLLAGGGVGAWFVNHSKDVDNNSIDASNQDSELFNYKGNNSTANSDEQGQALSQDINKSMTNSFSDSPAAITITKLSWQVSEKLAVENSVKEYLQSAGKNIQINLQNDLANASDVNFNNMIKVSFEIAQDNTLKGMQVLESSGSDQVDEIVVRSIKNTLKYIVVPKLKDYKSDYFLTLIINF